MKILELTLQTNNIAETEAFYTKTLGLTVIERSERSVSTMIGYSKLTFAHIDLVDKPKYHFAFNIPANQLKEAINWMSLRRQLIENSDKGYITNFENWRASAIYFFDNNGNILEFICRADLNNSSETEFGPANILNISEVGLVVEEPLRLAENIIDQTQIDYFPKGPKREDFVALGSDNGLFVISSPSRNWYPTGNNAEQQKVKVKIRSAGNDYDVEVN